MIARVVWVVYWVVAFGVAPAVFRRRFGRWPFVVRLPRDTYTIVEWGYGVLLAVFTLALMAAPVPASNWVPAGLAVTLCASALQAWAEWALGPSYRTGQDPDDASCHHVSHGPFRFMRHPIYVGLVLLALGQMLLMGLDWRSFMLLLGTIVYVLVQGRAEVRRWGA